MNHHLLLVIHLICASIWVGGHLYLSLSILPEALKRKEIQPLLHFEKNFGKLGMPALLVLVITGVWMASQFGTGWRNMFSSPSPIEQVVFIKLMLLFCTVLLAVSAQLRVIPKLKRNPDRLPEMAVHIVMVTLLGLAMLVLGSFVRYGGI